MYYTNAYSFWYSSLQLNYYISDKKSFIITFHCKVMAPKGFASTLISTGIASGSWGKNSTMFHDSYAFKSLEKHQSEITSVNFLELPDPRYF